MGADMHFAWSSSPFALPFSLAVVRPGTVKCRFWNDQRNVETATVPP
jgi:hypothetical protein